MSRWQTGTHGDRHCEDRSRILVLEFVIGQCVSRPPVEGYNIAEPLVCQLMCYQVQNPEPENMRHNIKKYEAQLVCHTSNTNICDTRNTKIWDTRNSINVVLSELNIKDNQKPKGGKCNWWWTCQKKDGFSTYLSSAFVLFLSISRPGVSNSIRPQFWCQKIKSTRLFGLFLPP